MLQGMRNAAQLPQAQEQSWGQQRQTDCVGKSSEVLMASL